MNRFAALLLFCIAVFLLFFTVAGEHGFFHLQSLNREYKTLAENNRQLESEIISLKNQVYGIQQDPDYLEKTAREQLGLSKPGEIVYIMPESD